MLSLELVQSTLLFCGGVSFGINFCFKNTLNQPDKRKRAFYQCLLLIAATFCAKLSYDMKLLPVNYYKVMEVSRHQSALDIRRSYKIMSKKYHPDKNPGPEAELRFQEIKVAYDVLMDESQRDIYNRFSTENLQFDPRKDEIKLISDISITYVFWGVICYLMTMSVGSRASRTWLVILGIIMLAVEGCFTMTEIALPEWMPQTLTEFEFVFFMHSAFPCIIALLCSLSSSLYVDIDETSLAILKDVMEHQQFVGQMLHELEGVLNADLQSSKETSENNSINHRNTINKLRDRMDESINTFSKRIEDLKKSSASPGSNYYWLIFVFVYGGIYYIQQ